MVRPKLKGRSFWHELSKVQEFTEDCNTFVTFDRVTGSWLDGGMFPDPEGLIFTESIEQGISSLAERVHFTPNANGDSLQDGHDPILYVCQTIGECSKIRRALRQTLAETIL